MRRRHLPEVVDLTRDENSDNALSKNMALARPLSTLLVDRGKEPSQSRADQQLLRTRISQPLSQKSTPAPRRDTSPSRKSNTTHNTPSYKHEPVTSGSSRPGPHISKPQDLDPSGDDIRHGISKYGLATARGSGSSSPLGLSRQTNKAEGLKVLNNTSAGTSLPPRLTLRGPSGQSEFATQSLGRRSSAFRSSGMREADEGRLLDTRFTPRRVTTGTSTSQANTTIRGESRRRTDRSRLGASSSGQQHIDGEDSDSDNAARALRHSINAVLPPISRHSEDPDMSGEDMINKTIDALSNRTDAAIGSQRQRLEGRRSKRNDDVHEAASANPLNNDLEEPAKRVASQIPVLKKPLLPVDGLASDMRSNIINLNSTTTFETQMTSKNPNMPSSTTEPRKMEMLGKQSRRGLSEADQPIQNAQVVLDETMGLNATLLKGLAPLTLESLTTILRRHEMAMWTDQGYLIKPLLRRAKLDCTQAAQPNLDRNLPDPFAAMAGDSFAPAQKVPTDVRNQTRSRLQTRLFNNSYTQSNDGAIFFDNIEYLSTASTLPKYKSIVRLGPNILAKNDRALKYMPYFTSEEDPQSRQKKELLDELHKRYDDRVETLPAQRKCGELAEFWRECVEDFLSEIEIGFQDVLYSLLHESARLGPDTPAALQSDEICPTCKTSCPREDWDDLLAGMDTDEFPQPEERKLALAAQASQAFLDVANFSIWHIAYTASSTRQLLRDLNESVPGSGKPSTLCLICYLHDCPTHGAYLERAPGSTSVSDYSDYSENDGELGHNVRQRVTLSSKTVLSTDEHKCGLYCVGPEIESRDILGLQPDGGVRGLFNTAVSEDIPAGLEDNQICGDDCFWPVEKREYRSTTVSPGPTLSSSDEKLSSYRLILPTFKNNRRGPCLISSGLDAVSCLDVFREMRSEVSTVHNHTHTLDISTPAKSKRSQHFDHEGENSNTHHLDNRIPFIPCSHAGPCDKDAACSCYTNRTSCEWMCGCSKTCGRRYPGCNCGAENNSVCFKDKRCLCWRLHRECDPWLCGTCGVLEVLDPVNRYNEEVQSCHCKNAKLQRDVPKRTLKGKSDVQGWGLFAGEDIKKHEYIGEYKGEVVGDHESNRRGAVYHHRGLEYLFNLNKGQEIDSSRAGNKMRFINNSCKAHIINVQAKKMFCNGVQRIMLFSQKHIAAGEELFFDYGYPKSVTKNFWERDDIPGQGDKEDHLDREEAAVGGPSTLRGGERPRKKGVGRRISSKKQSRSGGRWVKSMADEIDSSKGVADNDEEVRSLSTEDDTGVQRSSGQRKRKRSEAHLEVEQWAVPATEAEAAEQSGDGNVAADSSFHSAPEIAESEDDEFEDNLASQESSTDDEDEGDDLEDEEDSSSDTEVLSRRRISRGDTRYGGTSQRAGWATRRLKAAEAAEAAAAARPRKTRGVRSARGSWLGTGGRPPLRKRGK